MASSKELNERAEAAAGLEQPARVTEREATVEVTEADRPAAQDQEQKPGVIGSVLKAVQNTYEHAKEAVVGKSHEAGERVAEKASETKDAAGQKTGEYKDYAAETAKAGKDTTVSKMGELKDSTVDAAKRAMGYLSGKKEETKEATKEKMGEAEEETRRKVEELRLQGEGRDTEEAKVTLERESGGDGGCGGGAAGADDMSGQTKDRQGKM